MNVEARGSPEDFRTVYRVVDYAFGFRTVGVRKFRKEEIVTFAAFLFRFVEPEFRTFVNFPDFRFLIERRRFAVFSKRSFRRPSDCGTGFRELFLVKKRENVGRFVRNGIASE